MHAVERVIPALAIAEDAGIVRMFLDEGPRLGPLLARVERSLDPESRAPSIAFIARLRGSLAQERPEDEGTDIASGGLIEPLTPREREVLAPDRRRTHQPVDRQRAVPLCRLRQNPFKSCLRQARRPRPNRSDRPGAVVGDVGIAKTLALSARSFVADLVSAMLAGTQSPV